MATVTGGNNKIDWGLIRHNLGELIYLDNAIDWLLKLCAISAEFLLFFGAVYAGIKLYVGMPAWADTTWVVTQSVGLDIAGPGCFLLAKQAGEQGDTKRQGWAIAMGIILFILAVTNMAVGGIVSVFHIPEKNLDPTFVVSLLVIRASVAVGYTTVSRLSKTKKESTTFLRASTVDDKFQVLSSMLKAIETQNNEKIANVETEVLKRIDQISLSIGRFNTSMIETANRFNGQVESLENSFNQRLHADVSTAETGLTEYLNEALSDLNDTLARHAETLAILPALAEEMNGIKQQNNYHSRTVTMEIRDVKHQFEQQIKTLTAIQPTSSRQQIAAQANKPAKKTIETMPTPKSPPADFDIEKFVYGCLNDNGPEMKIPDIIAAAEEIGQKISVGSAHRYRTRYKTLKQPIESDIETQDTPGEISIVQVIETEN